MCCVSVAVVDRKQPAHRFLCPVSGKVILMLEDGTEYLLENPGDTVIQRGTMHAWRNPGPDIVRWVSVLVDAEPAVVNGRSLVAENRKSLL